MCKIRCSPTGIDRADLRANLAEHGFLGCDGHVAQGGQHVAAADRKTYWDSVARHLTCGVVIGDFNLNPERSPKEARMVPDGWRVVTPACGEPSFRSLKNDSASTVDHAFVTPEINVVAAEYRPEFFGKWKLDHCPLIVEILVGD